MINSDGWRQDSNGYPSPKGVSIAPVDIMGGWFSEQYEGGVLTIECDGVIKQIYVPSFTDIPEYGFISEDNTFFDEKLYVGDDGSTYYTSDLTVIAKRAP